MLFNPPKLITWVIALILFIVAVLIAVDVIALKGALATWTKWIPIVGLGLLLLANIVRGL